MWHVAILCTFRLAVGIEAGSVLLSKQNPGHLHPVTTDHCMV